MAIAVTLDTCRFCDQPLVGDFIDGPHLDSCERSALSVLKRALPSPDVDRLGLRAADATVRKYGPCQKISSKGALLPREIFLLANQVCEFVLTIPQDYAVDEL